MAAKRLPPREFLREALDYNPRTGEFRWRIRPISHFPSEVYQRRWNSKLAGKAAGTIRTNGYRQIHLQGRLYFAHRIAWLLVHGRPIPREIDHADGNPTNNRITNLRAATASDNRANTPGRGAITGVKGVSLDARRGKYRARIEYRRAAVWLGYFSTLEEAAAARREAAERLHGEFARHE